ncbi:MAG: trigger factor [Patescibacteria group bacterium]|jgi:trigger factor
MKIQKKNLPKAQLEITVELSTDELKPFLEKAAKKISSEVNIPGFRKGHVPYDILKKNVGEASIYEEAFYEAVNKTLPKIVMDEKIDFVAQPKVDLEKIAPGNPMVYKAVLALMPTITLGSYKELKAKRKKVEADEKKVKDTFSELQRMRAKEVVVERAAKQKDKVEMDFNVKLAGVGIEGGQATNYSLIIGEKKFIPGFEEKLVGMKKGEAKDFKLTFPKEYFDKKIAGKECDFHVKVQAVYEVSLPELNDEFAKGYNFKTWAELEKQIRDNIKKELEQKETDRLQLAILEEVVGKSQFSEFPDVLVDSEKDKMWHELEHNVEDSGGKIEDYLKHIKKTKEAIIKEWQEPALKRIKTALIAREVSKAEKIEVSDKEVEEEIKKNEGMYQAYPDLLKQIKTPEYKRYISNTIANRKTFERLASFVKD